MDTSLTPAAQVIIAIIPIVGIVFGATIVFFAILWRHHEIKQRIKNNSYTPVKFNWRAFTLLFGLCLIGVGLVLTAMFALLEGKTWAMLGGLIPLAIGIMLIIFYKLTSSNKSESSKNGNNNVF